MVSSGPATPKKHVMKPTHVCVFCLGDRKTHDETGKNVMKPKNMFLFHRPKKFSPQDSRPFVLVIWSWRKPAHSHHDSRNAPLYTSLCISLDSKIFADSDDTSFENLGSLFSN